MHFFVFYSCLCINKNHVCISIHLFLYNMQAWFFIFLFSDLSVSENNIFCCRQRFQPHRPSRMQFLRTDPDFCAKPKFKSICKSGGRIDIHCCCIDLILKTQRTVIIFCNDRLGMSGIIPVNMTDCLIQRSHCLHGNNGIQIFRSPIFF